MKQKPKCIHWIFIVSLVIYIDLIEFTYVSSAYCLSNTEHIENSHVARFHVNA